jgi:hypothetical protein
VPRKSGRELPSGRPCDNIPKVVRVPFSGMAVLGPLLSTDPSSWLLFDATTAVPKYLLTAEAPQRWSSVPSVTRHLTSPNPWSMNERRRTGQSRGRRSQAAFPALLPVERPHTIRLARASRPAAVLCSQRPNRRPRHLQSLRHRAPNPLLQLHHPLSARATKLRKSQPLRRRPARFR